MRSHRLVTVGFAVGAAAFGVGTELAAGVPDGVALAGMDLLVGVLLVGFGTAARLRRPGSRSGIWMGAAGLAWLAGTLGWPLVTLHRGFLVLLHLSYPSGRVPRSWLARGAVAAALVDAALPPLARNDRLTVVLAVMVAAAAVHVFLGSGGVDRPAAAPALLAAVAFAGILSLGAALRLAHVEAERHVLWSYDTVIALLAGVLFLDLTRARWSEAVLRGLVVDLGALRGSATLQRRLARALGDSGLAVGFWDDAAGVYLDEEHAVVSPPAPSAHAVATPIEDDGRPLALLVHDEAVPADPELIGSVAALARIAVANRSLEARIAEQAEQIDASRRRLVEARDDERRALRRTLARGPEQRLRHVSELVSVMNGSGPVWPVLQQELDAAIEQLRDLAEGVRPGELEHGLGAALRTLAGQSPLDVSVSVEAEPRSESVAAAAYFVCAEALANAAKHARTTSVRVEVARRDGQLVLEIADEGAGGADPGGSGLRGLADRVEALGGRLGVASAPGRGTRVRAEIPWSGP